MEILKKHLSNSPHSNNIYENLNVNRWTGKRMNQMINIFILCFKAIKKIVMSLINKKLGLENNTYKLQYLEKKYFLVTIHLVTLHLLFSKSNISQSIVILKLAH